DRLDRRLREQLRPEFVNRIDEIIIFRQLETAQLRQITELMLGETRRRLADKGYQPEFGARPLRRTIQRELDNRLSKLVLSADLKAGQTVKVDVADGKLAIT